MRPAQLGTTLLAVALTIACGDSSGPSRSAPFFAARVNNQTWPTDTAIALAFGSSTDTTLTVAAARTVSSAEEQEISLSIHGFSGTGQAPLGDSTAVGIGSLAILQINGGVVVSTTVYRTQGVSSGTATITRINREDSTVTGTFAFDAALTPDTAPHRHVTGSFTLRVGFIPVFPAQGAEIAG